MSDVLITPASSKIEFKDASNNIDGIIQLDVSGNLEIQAPNGDISLGDTSADIYIGNGTSNVDIIFEQNGEIRGLTGVTLTIGQSDSYVTFANSITVSGDVNSTSDVKFKDNIKTLTDSLYKVLSLRGVEYDRNDKNGDHQIGLIAQEVEEIIPDLVHESSDGLKAISYGNITAVLIEAIKEQQEQISILKEEIKNLKETK